MIDLLARNMNQRLAFALLTLAVSSALLAAGRLESSGYVTLMLGVVAAFFGQAALERWAEVKKP